MTSRYKWLRSYAEEMYELLKAVVRCKVEIPEGVVMR